MWDVSVEVVMTKVVGRCSFEISKASSSVYEGSACGKLAEGTLHNRLCSMSSCGEIPLDAQSAGLLDPGMWCQLSEGMTDVISVTRFAT
jgi:hypothetical protein